MLKRKRPVQTEEEIQAKVQAKLHHAHVECRRAMKKCIALEGRNAVKRLKRAEGSDTARLDNELEKTKTLDGEPIADYMLNLQIVKGHAALQALLKLDAGKAPHAQADDAEKNVVARIIGMKALRAAVEEAILRVEKAAGIAPIKKTKVKSSLKQAGDNKVVIKAKTPAEIPFATFEDDEEDDDEGQEEVMPRSRAQAAQPADATRSLFLPSLQTGYIPSTNDSDDEGELAALKGPAQPKPRKNRRGQRARRKILEQKHGKHANHLLQQRAAEQQAFEERQQKRAERTGANAIAVEEAAKNRAERRDRLLRPMHDSWQAAKRQKELQRTLQQQVKPTKIVF